MTTTKLITPKLGLVKKSDGQLVEFCAQRINNLATNAAAFPGLTPSLAQITATYKAFTDALEVCGRMGNPATTSAKNQAREKLCVEFTWCANSCVEIADGDMAHFEMSGFATKSRNTRTSSIDMPTDIKITQGPFDGSVYCSFTGSSNARGYEIQCSTTPNATSVLATIFTSTSRRIMITDLPSLSRCYLRIRALGARTTMSEWCNITEFKVL